MLTKVRYQTPDDEDVEGLEVHAAYLCVTTEMGERTGGKEDCLEVQRNHAITTSGFNTTPIRFKRPTQNHGDERPKETHEHFLERSPTRDFSQLKGGAHKRGRPACTEYAKISAAISSVRKKVTVTSSPSKAFWESVVMELGWSTKNLKRSVKVLRSIWCNNRGNIRLLVESGEGATRTKPREKRKRKPVRFSSNWVDINMKRKYCTCQTYYDNKRQYIHCKQCDEWYHYSCMRIPSTVKSGFNVTFYCGIGKCNNGKYVFQLHHDKDGVKLKENLNSSEIVHPQPTTAKSSHECNDTNTDSCKNESTQVASRVSNKTLSVLSGSQENNDDYVIKQFPKKGTFSINADTYNTVLSKRRGRCLPTGEWQKYFVDGMSKINPYCVIMFKYHYLIDNNTSETIFRAKGYCKFADCSVSVLISMDRNYSCTVNFNGNMKHSMYDIHARPIRGLDRRLAGKTLSMGVKPMKVLLRNLSSKSSEVIASGNRNDCGRTLSVMQKISSESRSKERDDEDEIKSLLKKQQKYCLKYNHRGRVPGFIQQISVSPMYIICFTEGGLRVWHDMCRTDVVFWDATGGVLDRGHGKKQILYYELSVRNLTKGWAVADDNTSLGSTLHTVTANNAYICVYEKVDNVDTQNSPTTPTLSNSSFVTQTRKTQTKDDMYHEKVCNPTSTSDHTTGHSQITKEGKHDNRSPVIEQDRSTENIEKNIECADDIIDLTTEDEVAEDLFDPQRRPVTRGFGINVMVNDLKLLMEPDGWLNDNIINFYLNLLSEAAQKSLNTKHALEMWF
ncbi:uncharacterized protein [Apostichopus japonicus]|uniref:uncharacterized protein n=1 Tax=Stichopus japonicus TaxID=307972 RepID=UPI003AB65319